MGDSEFEKALKREAEWLDAQLADYAARLPVESGFVPAPASNPISFDAPDTAPEAVRPGLRFENSPAFSPDGDSRDFVIPETTADASSGIHIVQPPQPKSRWKRPSISGSHALMALLLVVAAGFAIWQTVLANGYKRQAAQAAANAQSWAAAQVALDNSLCASGYPGVFAAIKAKADADADLTESEKALLAFGEYRSAAPNMTGDVFRVDADPPCTTPDAEGGEAGSTATPKVGAE